MDSSRSFFEHAKSKRIDDFESYCRRIGGLNAWRIPLTDTERSRRFAVLSELLELTIRSATDWQVHDYQWSDFHYRLDRQITALVRAWEEHHLSASLATA